MDKKHSDYIDDISDKLDALIRSPSIKQQERFAEILWTIIGSCDVSALKSMNSRLGALLGETREHDIKA